MYNQARLFRIINCFLLLAIGTANEQTSNRVKLDLLTMIDAEHPLYSADDSGKLSGSPFMFDPAKWIYRISFSKNQQGQPNCRIGVFYESDRSLRLAYSAKHGRSQMAEGDFFMTLVKGVNEIDTDTINQTICEQALVTEIRGVSNILEAIKTQNLTIGYAGNRLEPDTSINLPMSRFVFKEVRIDRLRDWLSFSDPVTTKKMRSFLDSQASTEPLAITNSQTVGKAQAKLAEDFADWSKKLSTFCDTNDFAQSGLM